MPLDDLSPHLSVCCGLMCDHPYYHCDTVLCKCIEVCGYSDQKVNDSKRKLFLTFDLIFVELTFVNPSMYHFVKIPCTCIKECGYSDQKLSKGLWPRTTPRWPSTPHHLRSYVWLYPMIIVPLLLWKSHQSMWIQLSYKIKIKKRSSGQMVNDP